MRRIGRWGRFTPNFLSLSSGWIESRCPSNFPVAKYSIYSSKPSNALVMRSSVCWRVGEAKSCSQRHPHLKVHHLHFSTVPACTLEGGVCGGELSRRGRLRGRSDDVGEHVCEQE